MYQVSTDKGTAWEQRFCPTDWCPIETVQVRRYVNEHEVWRITPSLDEFGWLVAMGPVCPLCGGDLLTTANAVEGIGSLEPTL